MKPADPSKVIIVPRPPVNDGGQAPPATPASPAQAEQIQPQEIQPEPCEPQQPCQSAHVVCDR